LLLKDPRGHVFSSRTTMLLSSLTILAKIMNTVEYNLLYLMHLIGRLSRVIPWTCSGIACRREFADYQAEAEAQISHYCQSFISVSSAISHHSLLVQTPLSSSLKITSHSGCLFIFSIITIFTIHYSFSFFHLRLKIHISHPL